MAPPIDDRLGPRYYRGAHKPVARVEESLRADDGWLTVAGLFWLAEGANSVGADPANDIVLPAGSAPEHVASFDFHNGQTTLRVIGDARVTVNGAPAFQKEVFSALQSS